MSIELILSLVGALAASFKWIYEYARKSKWERNAFLIGQIEKFQDLESTQTMEKILDWNSVTLILDGREFFIDDYMLLEALKTHDVKHKFSKGESRLRGIFDDYFDNLTKFIFMSEVGLIDRENLTLFLEYWFKILSGESKSKSVKIVEAIRNYLEFYGYETLIEFLDDYKNT